MPKPGPTKTLHTTEGLKQAHFSELREAQKNEALLNAFAVRLAQGSDVSQFRDYGQQLRDETQHELVTTLERILSKPIRDSEAFEKKLTAAGYRVQADEQGKGVFIHQPTGATFSVDEIQPNGQ